VKAIKFFIPAILLIIVVIALSNHRYYNRVNQEYSLDKAELVTAMSNAISNRLIREKYGEIEKIEVHQADVADELRLKITWLNSEFIKQMDYQYSEPRTEFVIDTKVVEENDMLLLFIWPCVRSVEQQSLTLATKERLMQVEYLLDALSDFRLMVPLTSDAQWPPSVSERMQAITQIKVSQNSVVFSTGIPRISGQAYKRLDGWEGAFDGICLARQDL